LQPAPPSSITACHRGTCRSQPLRQPGDLIRAAPPIRIPEKNAGTPWSPEEESSFKQPVLDLFERQSHPLYASARLWDDGVIDPAKSRDVLGLSLSAALNAPIEETRFGLFRM